MNTKLWIFWFYTVIFMSVYAIVMVSSMESRVQNLQNNVNVMECPLKSPDLSPIEQVWDLLDKRVRQPPVQP